VRRAIITGEKRIEVTDVDEPVPAPDEVKLKVQWCGICGSDVLEYLHPDGFSQCLGHEFAGTVVETGGSVANVKCGDTVAAYAYDAKGFSDYALAPAEHVVVLPESVSPEQGALVEPVTVVLTALRHCGFLAGDNCFVSGCGSIGLIGIELLRAFGARKIIGSEPNAYRREMAIQLGADVVIDPSCEPVEQAVLRAVGDKVDFSLECVGAGKSLLSCMRVTHVGRMVCALGLTPQRLDVSSYDLFLNNVKVQGSTPYDFGLFEASARLIADGGIEPLRIVTHRFELERIAEAFELAASRDSSAVKILVRCAHR